MSRTYIPTDLRRFVRVRAGDCCEYCLISENATFAALEVDHIVAEKHGGRTFKNNLALCCSVCNKRNGSDLTSIDDFSGEIIPLFHPRNDRWSDHFHIVDNRIEATTPTGRVTVRLLQFNNPDRVEERKLLLAAGLMQLREE